MPQEYDVIIIGGGPAGLTAGIYAARARRRTLLLEKETLGGQIANTERVENYPGFPEGINGLELGLAMQEQATKFGMEMAFGEVTEADLKSKPKVIKTDAGEEYRAKAVIIAGGAHPKVLGIPGEEEFTGSGVAYCAMCDGPQFAGQDVAVVGGGDAGVEEGMYIARYANKVTVVEVMPKLTAAKSIQEAAKANPKMSFITNTTVESINGDGAVKSLTLRNNATGEKTELPVAGVFMYVGQQPNTQYLQGILNLDKDGFIITNDKMETGIPGVFAAGDIRQKSARQVVTAAGDGATAAHSADKYLEALEG